jgi:ABC-type transporter Mla subunit MlaD
VRRLAPGGRGGGAVRRLLAALLVAGACAAALLLTGATSKQGDKRTYKIVFDNAFGLVEGGDFRVGGVKAGQTKTFEIQKRRGRAPKAVVTAEVNEPGFDDFREDASCTILPQSLIGEYYVDCQTGNSKKKLPTNGKGTVPVEQTESTIPADLVGNVLRRPYRERFRMILTELGTGLAGRPADLQAVLRRAHPGLRETSRVLKILGDQNQVIENFIRDSDTVVAELEANKRDVARWVVEAGNAAEISATRREDIARGFRRLPRFLDELRPTMRRLGELADEQTPLLTELQRAAPDLDTFFSRLGPFSKASRPALRALGKSSLRGTQAFREGKSEVATLKALAPEAPPTFKPLRQFTDAMDERRRATEIDSRAKVGGPPSPDPTAIPASGSGGFTGWESLWNYFYWQTLSINGYDDVGHILRASLTVPGDCAELHSSVDPKSATFRNCSQWLGPDLPGITTRDFSDGSAPSFGGSTTGASSRGETRRRTTRVGERRAPGEPDAGPLPGQRDISKPQYALPPALQQLIDRLGGQQQLPKLPGAKLPQNAPKLPEGVPQAPQGAPQTDGQSNQLLDFLLSP